ncbi:MAG: HEAT repeat domain-containing protein [Thermoplasmata archaeon]
MDNSEAHIAKLVRDLAHPEVYNRKHAAWTLARIAQKGGAEAAVKAEAVPKLAACLEDSELVVRYRALWALLELAKRGQKTAVLEAGVVKMISGMVADETEVEVCHPHSDEVVFTQIGTLAREVLELLQI